MSTFSQSRFSTSALFDSVSSNVILHQADAVAPLLGFTSAAATSEPTPSSLGGPGWVFVPSTPQDASMSLQPYFGGTGGDLIGISGVAPTYDNGDFAQAGGTTTGVQVTAWGNLENNTTYGTDLSNGNLPAGLAYLQQVANYVSSIIPSNNTGSMPNGAAELKQTSAAEIVTYGGSAVALGGMEANFYAVTTQGLASKAAAGSFFADAGLSVMIAVSAPGYANFDNDEKTFIGDVGRSTVQSINDFISYYNGGGTGSPGYTPASNPSTLSTSSVMQNTVSASVLAANVTAFSTEAHHTGLVKGIFT